MFVATQKKREIATDDKVDVAKADELKANGNKLMASKDFKGAIDFYSQAIKHNPTNAVLFANRAAAYSQDGDHSQAIVDAKKSIELDASYSKGYSRLGHALFCSGSYAEAVDAYETGLKMEPGNASMKQALASAKQKVEALTPRESSAAADGPSNGLDFASMMNNPNVMNMASQFMGNPDLGGMMNNPQFAAMMNNPQISKM